MFAKALNLGVVAEMRHRDLNEEIIAQRTNIQVRNNLFRVGVFEPEEFGFDLLARPRHDLFALVECGPLRQQHFRIGPKRLFGEQMQDRFRAAAARFSAVVSEVRNLMIVLRAGN